MAQFAVGGWALLFPRAFFDIPWVGMRMPYNARLMMDYGAVIHLRLLHHLTPGERVPLLTALTVAVVVALVLLPLTSR